MAALGAIGTHGSDHYAMGVLSAITSENGYLDREQEETVFEWVAGPTNDVHEKVWVSPNYNPDATVVAAPAQFLGGAYISG